MLVTEFGIVTDVNLEQFLKEVEPMVMTELGIVTVNNDVQSRNADRPMLVILEPIVTFAKLLKALHTDAGIIPT
jgi:hypothetical protein